VAGDLHVGAAVVRLFIDSEMARMPAVRDSQVTSIQQRCPNGNEHPQGEAGASVWVGKWSAVVYPRHRGLVEGRQKWR